MPGQAHRCTNFLPMAFSGPILEDLGITKFVPTISVLTAEGGEIPAKLDRQPEYVAALALARRHCQAVRMDHDVYEAIACGIENRRRQRGSQ
ncbi:hypothetical protein ACVWZA_003582 [Sphingomonas sp. UYAg733]